jgi:hypothetical protein
VIKRPIESLIKLTHMIIAFVLAVVGFTKAGIAAGSLAAAW